MHNKHTFFKYSTLALAVTYSLGANTQESADEAANETVIEKIQVTGSRIARDPNLAAPSPIQSISAQEIQVSGEFSITDVINDIPALFSSTTAESSIDSGFADGANILNLRGLGSSRTLTIVNGRRHVGGVGGSAAVDVGSIPMALIESVDVLTGGASAVYGADAVTGVVNFNLRDDFEGFKVDIQTGRSGENDAEQLSISSVWGTNFDNDRGNFAVSVEYQDDKGLRVSERKDGLIRGSARDWTNPALRFQQGDLGASTPNLSQYYNFANTGLFPFGLSIPSMAAFISNYTSEFGSAPNLTDAEMALFNQASTAAPRAVLPYRTFPFTSGYGYIIPGNPYTFDGFDPNTPIDLDGNGTPDCLDSFSGYNSVFGAASFGVLGGCWNVNEDGSYRPINDGLVSGNFEGFGGDSYNTLQQQRGYIITPNDKIAVNFLFNYDISDNVRAFAEAKYVLQTTENESQPTAFWDLLFGAPDNPYLPAFIQPIANATGGVAITADPIGIGSGRLEQERETVRIVAGFEGTLAEEYDYEVYVNYGKFTREARGTEDLVIVDRFFSAIDAVSNNGLADCRVNVDAAAPQISTPFNIPSYDPGYFTFTPGDGSCVPLNIWNGRPGIDQAAVDWITEDSFTKVEIDQLVFAANLAGDSSNWFEMPYGPIYWAVGTEYREESSDSTIDDFRQGFIPAGSQFAEGTNIADYSSNNSIVFRPALRSRNQGGEYDVWEAFVETSIPLIEGKAFVEELTLDVAARYSDYSTVGETFTWRTNLMYSPFSDLRIRYSLSKAVRAPNISELFAPETGTTFRPTDTCNASVIQGIAGNDAAAAAQIQANCVAEFETFGLNPFDTEGDYVYTDPLSASFGGVTGGNPNLLEEEADTTTIGFVYDSSVIEGLTVTVDYWSISIDQAISAVSADDIVNGCYTGAQLNDNFCSLFTRNTNAASPQFGGLDFLRTTDINFAKLETSGVDFTIGYEHDVFDGNLRSTLAGSKVNELDQFTNPNDLSEVNPELGEIQRPEYAGNLAFNWSNDVLSIGLQNQYIGEQLLGFVEIEEFERGDYDPSVQMDAMWLHDINASYKIDDVFTVYGGINNLTDEQPFLTNFAYPVGPRGRFFFLGLDMKFN
ncbi:MAG: iron complex outermembrane receptor protein [Glaciecola sp.]|jgi:outer membrane receptor protein involved in Fe transport